MSSGGLGGVGIGLSGSAVLAQVGSAAAANSRKPIKDEDVSEKNETTIKQEIPREAFSTGAKLNVSA
jgi:hypothetical protein